MRSRKFKNIYSKGLLVLGVLAMTTACSDTLELAPKTTWSAEEFYQNESDMNAALAGIHSFISGFNTFGGTIQQMNVGTDESYKLKSWNVNYPTGIMDHNPATAEIRTLYRDLYGGINNCNNFLKYIKAENFETEEIYNNYIGEAYFLRGLMYYHLSLWFNEIPLRLEPTLDQSSNHVAPSSNKVVYEQIISDLTMAAENLYDSFDDAYIIGHSNKMAAHAMLAKIYLKAGGYPENLTEINGKNPYEAARDHCQVIMDDPNYGLNSSYKDVFLNYIQNRYDLRETLFEISYMNGTALGINTGGRMGYVNGLFYGISGSRIGEPGSSPEISPSPIHEQIYELGDLRKTWNVPGYGANKNQWNPNGIVAEKEPLDWGYTPGKFRRWDAAFPDDLVKTNEQLTPVVTLESPEPLHQSITGINYPMLRYSDVLLMYAEAVNEINDGPTASAIDAINRVRNRAGLVNLADVVRDPFDYSGGTTTPLASKDDFFLEIVDERFKELCFEGHRKHDLIRWNKLEEKMEALYESIIFEPGYNASHAFRHRSWDNFEKGSTKHLSLPYPEQEVLINNKLDQKDLW